MTTKPAPYELVYWPGTPGRGEHIRLCFEATGTTYIDVSNSKPDGIQAVLARIDPTSIGDAHNPPTCAPPILKHGDLVINQTPNILLYLGPKLGLVPSGTEDENAIYHVNQLALTALDGLSNEPHDTHHPVDISLYYEDQKPEALRKAQAYTKSRLPKFLGYFERVLKGPKSGGGEWLYGGKMTYADLVLFQCMDGVEFAFPNAMKRLEKSGEYTRVFALYEKVKASEKIKSYLGSERRMKYSMGIYRYYPELDEEA